jgi:hypothetical protein
LSPPLSLLRLMSIKQLSRSVAPSLLRPRFCMMKNSHAVDFAFLDIAKLRFVFYSGFCPYKQTMDHSPIRQYYLVRETYWHNWKNFVPKHLEMWSRSCNLSSLVDVISKFHSKPHYHQLEKW